MYFLLFCYFKVKVQKEMLKYEVAHPFCDKIKINIKTEFRYV